MVNIYLVVPESAPVIGDQWLQSNEQFLEEDAIVDFISNLKLKIEVIRMEKYDGFYDSHNILNFLRDFEIVSDYFPNPAFRRLRSLIKSWNNWRDDKLQKSSITYSLFTQAISNNSLCEVRESQFINDHKENDAHAILNHFAYNLPSSISISRNRINNNITILSTEYEIKDWFITNRIPKRNFQITDKHGENRQDIRVINGEIISPLRCSKEHAFELLKSAIGDSKKDLYNFDPQNGEFIVFKFEGNNPQNMYHGYHVPVNTNEIPQNIKEKLSPQ